MFKDTVVISERESILLELKYLIELVETNRIIVSYIVIETESNGAKKAIIIYEDTI